MSKMTDDASVEEGNLDTEVSDASEDNEVDEIEDLGGFEDEVDEDTEDSDESESDEQASEFDEETDDESDADEGNQSPDEEKEDEDDTASDSDKDAAEKRRLSNEEAARKRIADKEAREQAKRESQKQFVEEAESDQDRALRQLQVVAYNQQVQTNKDRLENGIDKAVANIDLFTKGTAVQKEELIAALDDFEENRIVKAENGDVLEIKGDVYDFLSRKAESIRRLTGEGVRTAAKDKSKTRTRTDTLPSKKPKEGKKDADLEAFDEEANKY